MLFRFFAILLIASLCISDAVAQEAPARFKFIREADTTVQVYPYGDTVMLIGPAVFESSIDGGETWSVRQKDVLH